MASTFSSPMYGYAIGLPAGWTATAATTVADDPAGTEDTHADRFVVPGTDTTITVYALDLGSQTYEEWAKEVHDDMVANLPSGCDGGDPSTWPDVPVGSAQGHWLRKCNEAVALVPLGKRIYVFVWGHETFEEMRHLPESSFKEFLLGVRLPDAATAEKPLWSPPP